MGRSATIGLAPALADLEPDQQAPFRGEVLEETGSSAPATISVSPLSSTFTGASRPGTPGNVGRSATPGTSRGWVRKEFRKRLPSSPETIFVGPWTWTR